MSHNAAVEALEAAVARIDKQLVDLNVNLLRERLLAAEAEELTLKAQKSAYLMALEGLDQAGTEETNTQEEVTA